MNFPLFVKKIGVNVWDVIKLANRHPRVNILTPGAGVGGHCIAVDPWFIIDSAPKESILIKQARMQNLYKTEWVISKIKEKAEFWKNENKKEPIIACLGLAFKPDIDDLRESPALFITRKLVADGYKIVAVEPNIKNSDEFNLISVNSVAEEADVFVFLVGHKEFKTLKFKENDFLDFCGIKQ